MRSEWGKILDELQWLLPILEGKIKRCCEDQQRNNDDYGHIATNCGIQTQFRHLSYSDSQHQSLFALIELRSTLYFDQIQGEFQCQKFASNDFTLLRKCLPHRLKIICASVSSDTAIHFIFRGSINGPSGSLGFGFVYGKLYYVINTGRNAKCNEWYLMVEPSHTMEILSSILFILHFSLTSYLLQHAFTTCCDCSINTMQVVLGFRCIWTDQRNFFL